MLIAPLVWYDCVPGVIDTGLFNQHFIRILALFSCSSASLLASV